MEPEPGAKALDLSTAASSCARGCIPSYTKYFNQNVRRQESNNSLDQDPHQELKQYSCGKADCQRAKPAEAPC